MLLQEHFFNKTKKKGTNSKKWFNSTNAGWTRQKNILHIYINMFSYFKELTFLQKSRLDIRYINDYRLRQSKGHTITSKTAMGIQVKKKRKTVHMFGDSKKRVRLERNLVRWPGIWLMKMAGVGRNWLWRFQNKQLQCNNGKDDRVQKTHEKRLETCRMG